MEFIPNKNFAENHLKNFIEKYILDYSKLRNFDYGPQNRNNISLLSPYISHRVLFEFDVVKDVLRKYPYLKVDKFVQEIFWRVYWKGWLELRPAVWDDFTSSLDNIKTSQSYIEAINANTNATTTIGTNVSKTIIGTQINLRATTVNTLFGTNTTLSSTLTVVGLDSGARLTIPLTITKTN